MAKNKELEEVKTKKNVNTKKKTETKKETKKVNKETKNSDKKVNKVNKVSKKDNVSKKEVKEEVVLENVKEENNDSSKKKNVLKTIIYCLIAVIILGALIYSIIESNERSKHFKTISFNQVDALMNDTDTNIIYWAQPNCGFCTQFTPIVKQTSYSKGVTFNYLNTANLTQDEYATMITYLSAYKEDYASGLGTPSLILVKEGKVIDVQVGALSEEGLISFLTTSGLIK